MKWLAYFMVGFAFAYVIIMTVAIIKEFAALGV